MRLPFRRRKHPAPAELVVTVAGQEAVRVRVDRLPAPPAGFRLAEIVTLRMPGCLRKCPAHETPVGVYVLYPPDSAGEGLTGAPVGVILDP